MSLIYKCYCPFCDTGLSFEQQDIFTEYGNRVIRCPECNRLIILPTEDANNSDYLEKDELPFVGNNYNNLNNPNKFVLQVTIDDDDDGNNNTTGK